MSVGETYLTVQGRVGGDVRFKEVSGKVALASFRIGTTPRQFDRTTGGWIDRPTAWFTVECWRTLAQNVHDSLQRGHPVVVTGRLKTTEWIEEGEKKSRTVIDAFSVGHDLARGTTSFKKNPPRPQSADGTSLDGEMRELSDDAETDEPGAEDSPFSAEEVAAVHDRESERQTPDRQAA